jgi:hypothetical protein
MKEQMLDEVVARRFLLGQLSPDEQGRIEELAFDDPRSFEVLQAAEDDLIDEFVYDDLSSEERERFQEYYLAQPGRREDVRIAKALRGYFDREQPVTSFWDPVRRWFQVGATPLLPLLAKAAIVIATAVIAYVNLIPRIIGPGLNPVYQVQNGQPSPLPSPTSTASEQPPQPSPSPAPKESPNKRQPPTHRPSSPVYANLLSPGALARSPGEVTKVSLTSKAMSIHLLLIDRTPYRSYQATLEQGGATLKTWSKLKLIKIPPRKGFQIPIPFDQLKASQRYRIVLQGVGANGNLEYVHEYHFEATN